MWEVFMQHRDFWLFRFGQLCSAFGDLCGFFGLSWWLLAVTGSVSAMSWVVGPGLAVRLLLRPLFGVWGDRISRKSLAFAGDLASGISWFAIFAYVVYGGQSLIVLSLLSCLSGASGALFSSGSEAMIPMLVPREEIPRALRKWESVSVVLRVVGGGLGGALVQWIGGPQTFLLNAGTFILGAVATQLIQSDTTPQRDDGAGRSRASAMTLSRLVDELRSGLHFATQAKVMFHTAIVLAVITFLVAPIDILLPKYILGLRGSSATLGLLVSVRGIGSLLGLALLSRFRRQLPGHILVLIGCATMGLCIFVLGVLPSISTLGVALFLVGVTATFVNLPLLTQIDLVLPETQRSRFHSWLSLIVGGSAPLGVMMAGAHETLWGELGVYAVLGSAVALTSLLIFVIPNFARFMSLTPNAARDFLKETYSLGETEAHAGVAAH